MKPFWLPPSSLTELLVGLSPMKHLLSISTKFNPIMLLSRFFCCVCWPNLRPYNQHKLQFRSKECVFLSYSNLHKRFRCLDVATGCIYISCDVTFDEEVFPFSKLHLNAGPKLRSEVHLLSVRFGHDGVVDPHTNDYPANQLYGENFDVQNKGQVDA
jgi:hypothetical protein